MTDDFTRIRDAVVHQIQIDPEQIKRQFARALRARRKEVGLTQAGLSEMTGVSLRAISGYEAGTASPNLPQLALLVNALELPMSAFPPSWVEPAGVSPVDIALRRLRRLRTELDLVIEELADHLNPPKESPDHA